MSNVVTIIGMRGLLRRWRYMRHDIATNRLMREVGLFLTSQIQIRTAEGKDVEDRRFMPYSPAYRLFREKSGRSGSKVNLFFTGSMMSAMTFEETDDTVRLFFQNTSDPSGARNPLKAYFLNQEREFFALSEEDRQGALEIVDDHIRRVLRRR